MKSRPIILNTPRVITDGSNNVVWEWKNEDPFGYNLPTSSNGFEFNLRFPGQYFDRETGLHYNYYRDYDPSTGRYIQSDPIGFAAGPNTYAYVEGNPLSYIDPAGLAVCTVIFPDYPIDTGMGFTSTKHLIKSFLTKPTATKNSLTVRPMFATLPDSTKLAGIACVMQLIPYPPALAGSQSRLAHGSFSAFR